MIHFLRRLSTSTPPLRILVSESTNPFLNLATEEWLFRNADVGRHTLFLWRNDKSIIIGRNQNVWKECHMDAVESNNVELVRRGSGGGAVYQDLGNTCFTFLSPLSTYGKDTNTRILINALSTFGVTATAAGRNDMHVDGRKISGSAFKQNSQRAFHHGTLLINVDMSMMQKLLNPNKAKLLSKGVASVQQRVLNLQLMYPHVNHDALISAIQTSFAKEYTEKQPVVETLNDNTVRANSQLMHYFNELSSWDWRFGRNPDFSHQLETRFDWGIIDISMEVKNGRIVDAVVFSDSLRAALPPKFARALIGCEYSAKGIEQALERCRTLLSGGTVDDSDARHRGGPDAIDADDERSLQDIDKWLRLAL